MSARGMGLTRHQADLARIIEELTELHGRPPLQGEVADEMCLSSEAVKQMLDGLQDRSWLASRNPLVLAQPAPPIDERSFELTQLALDWLAGDFPLERRR